MPAVRGVSVEETGRVCLDRGAFGVRQIHPVLPAGRAHSRHRGPRGDRRRRFCHADNGERTRLRKHRIGFVFQKFNLLPTLTAMGNIEIAYSISGRKEPLDKAYLDHLSEMLAIKGRLDHRPSELSGGEQQRVAIAPR